MRKVLVSEWQKALRSLKAVEDLINRQIEEKTTVTKAAPKAGVRPAMKVIKSASLGGAMGVAASTAAPKKKATTAQKASGVQAASTVKRGRGRPPKSVQ